MDTSPSTSAGAAVRLPNSNDKKDFLNGARGLAALYVVYTHAICHTESLLNPIVRSFSAQGHFAVDAFIVLSGFCLMLPILKNGKQEDYWTFMKRRFLRIIPPYYAAMMISLALIATVIGAPTNTHWDVSLPITKFDLVTHTLLIHEWFYQSSAKINHAFWSIGVEWKIYFLFPLLVWLRNRIGIEKTTVITVIASYAVWLVVRKLHLGNTGPWGISPYYTGLFCLGMLGAEIAERSSADKLKRYAGIALTFLTVGLIAAAIWVGNFDANQRLPLISLFVGCWFTALLIRLDGGNSLTRRILSSRLLGFLGTLGYSIYLLHAPIIQLLYVYAIHPISLSPNMENAVLAASSCVVAIPVCWAFYLVFERPFHTLSRSIGRIKPVAPAIAPASV